ncbi:MAG TPA: ROK family protein [Desulfuromonadaceae bacterium]|jgi:glucokinase
MEYLYIGIDIGGTNLRFALVTGSGDILHRSRMFSNIENGRQDFCNRLLMGIEELRLVAASRNASVAGIGAGVPGLIDRKGLIHSSVNMRPLDGFNLAVFIKDETGLPAVCANDANLIALGEQAFRAGRRFASCIVVTIGTGLGSGLILDGRLWTGASGFAAEFGHATVAPEGLPCPCGNRGCLERYVSAGALIRFASETLSPEFFEKSSDLQDAAMIARLARGGEQGAIKAFDLMGRWLAIGLASLVNTLNLEAIIIGGGVAASFDLLLPALTAELEKRCFPEIFADLSIVKSELGDDAGLLGGAALIASLMTESI